MCWAHLPFEIVHVFCPWILDKPTRAITARPITTYFKYNIFKTTQTRNKKKICWPTFKKMVVFGFLNGPFNYGKAGKQCIMWYSADLASFLFSCSIVQKKRICLGPCKNITTMCRKITFSGVRVEILLSRDKVSLESRAGPFLGFVQKYKFLEKYSPLDSFGWGVIFVPHLGGGGLSPNMFFCVTYYSVF